MQSTWNPGSVRQCVNLGLSEVQCGHSGEVITLSCGKKPWASSYRSSGSTSPHAKPPPPGSIFRGCKSTPPHIKTAPETPYGMLQQKHTHILYKAIQIQRNPPPHTAATGQWAHTYSTSRTNVQNNLLYYLQFTHGSSQACIQYHTYL